MLSAFFSALLIALVLLVFLSAILVDQKLPQQVFISLTRKVTIATSETPLILSLSVCNTKARQLFMCGAVVV